MLSKFPHDAVVLAGDFNMDAKSAAGKMLMTLRDLRVEKSFFRGVMDTYISIPYFYLKIKKKKYIRKRAMFENI